MIEPRSDYLLCTRYERPEESPGGIVIPEAFREDKSGFLWEVVAVGPGRMSRKGHRKPCDCKPGDIVHSEHPYVGMEVEDDDGTTYYLISESQILHIQWRPEP